MTPDQASYRQSPRTTLGRLPQRGGYDRGGVHAILDACALCQVGYVADGQPLVLSTVFWRTGERVYWHGSRESRAIKTMAGAQVCFSVSRLDGLVLARSAFHHSVNYRSVMAFGVAREVEGEVEKLEALSAMIERFYPGRWARIRRPSRAELAAATVLSLTLDEVSAKVRAGPPLDAQADLDIPVWAGVAPLMLAPGELAPCAELSPDCRPPQIDWAALGATGG
jgi:nitroimidazol reductase NimA-like FMN-containing flavoprotein (pyridoxamine 5'-phosphate oxidase superfamily)